MNYALVNDTSLWHAGSEACVESIVLSAKAQGLHRRHVYATCAKIPDDGFDDCPLVIVNGEGSMHHDRTHKTAGWVLDAILKAANEGRRVWLVNSLWHEMSDGAADIVRDCCEYVQVRELFSSRELDAVDIPHRILLDASVPMNLHCAPDWCKDFLAMKHGLPNTHYHHAAIAGLIMRVPFVYRRRNRNTPPKVEGIFAWMGNEIPALENLDAWRKAWNAFDLLPRFHLPAAIPVEA